MSITVTYECSGCDAIETVRGLMQRWDLIRPGATFDLCQIRTPTIKTAAPEGWMPFDPYTGCCYCPKCWAWIEAPADSLAASSEAPGHEPESSTSDSPVGLLPRKGQR